MVIGPVVVVFVIVADFVVVVASECVFVFILLKRVLFWMRRCISFCCFSAEEFRNNQLNTDQTPELTRQHNLYFSHFLWLLTSKRQYNIAFVYLNTSLYSVMRTMDCLILNSDSAD